MQKELREAFRLYDKEGKSRNENIKVALIRTTAQRLKSSYYPDQEPNLNWLFEKFS